MQKLAGIITESQMKDKLKETDDYTPPAYEPINDLMDEIFQATGMHGDIKPYYSVSWLPKMHETDGNPDTLFYKKGNQEIAIGLDWEGTDPENPNWDGEEDSIWQINGNTPEVDNMFDHDLRWDEVVAAVSSWLKS